MSGKFHVNDDNEANPCGAKSNESCPFGDSDHFDNREEAGKEAESRNAKKHGGSFGTKLKPASNNTKTEKVVEIEKRDTTASKLKAGQVLSGQKFENGQWKDNDALIVKVSKTVDFDMKERVAITYDDGNVVDYAGRSPVTVKVPKDTPVATKSILYRSDFRKAKREMERNVESNKVTSDQVENFVNLLNDANAEENAASVGERVSLGLRSNGDSVSADKIDEACKKIRLSYDLNYGK